MRFSRSFAYEDPFRLFDELRAQMNQALDPPALDGSLELVDRGDAFVISADVPGLTEADISLTVKEQRLTLEGTSKTAAPEGLVLRRRERTSPRLHHEIALPARIDSSAASATVRNGVLTVTLPKAQDAQPRQIPVRADN